MADFPYLENPTDISEQNILAQVKVPFQAGYGHSRKQHTRPRKKFTLSYNYMDEGNLFGTGGYMDHFNTNQGGSFNFTHPARGTTYTVRYAEDGIDYTISRKFSPYKYKVTIKLEEL